MTDDIVADLRSTIDQQCTCMDCRLKRVAAAEIERLRAELERVKQPYVELSTSGWREKWWPDDCVERAERMMTDD